jgi:tetratricopeptide (TPR) repeat protein
MKELEEIEQLIKSSTYTKAIEKLNSLSVNNSELNNEIQRVWASLYARQRNYSSAVEAYSVIIDSGKAETKDYFLGAFWNMYNKNYQRAYDWLLLSLEKGKEENEKWYELSNIFYLACTSMELKKYDEALNHIKIFNQMADADNEECFVPIYGVISGKQLLSEIKKRKKESIF